MGREEWAVIFGALAVTVAVLGVVRIIVGSYLDRIERNFTVLRSLNNVVTIHQRDIRELERRLDELNNKLVVGMMEHWKKLERIDSKLDQLITEFALIKFRVEKEDRRREKEENEQ